MFLTRNIAEKVQNALRRSPVVLITGARQTGKTTLIKHIFEGTPYSYISFDDIRYLSAAQSDPIGFLNNLSMPIILDEVQLIPEIFLPIKSMVDKNRKPGMFVLTGSANPLLIPRLGDSLAGRMEIIELYPFSQGELEEKKESFIQTVFSESIAGISIPKISRVELAQKMVAGGYPPVCKSETRDREAWLESYLTTILQRDVKDLAKIEGLAMLPNLLALLATRAGGLANVAELSRASGISNATLHRYLILLETIFLITFLQPWSSNAGKSLVKSPKVYIPDTGMLLFLLSVGLDRILREPQNFGKALENFVVSELVKQVSWHDSRVKIFFYRTQSGVEIDVLLENTDGHIVGIEVKGSETVSRDDFKGLKSLKEDLGETFHAGFVLYAGTETIPFGNNLWALPTNVLWR